MKRKYMALVAAIVILALSLVAVPVYAQDNVLDKVSDWWAVRGKKDPEKTMILTQRKAERAAKRAQKEAEKQAKQAGKEMEKAQKNIFGK